MPFTQRSQYTSSYYVYTSGNYSNPNWITSLSPAKVGSGIAQWNAASIIGYPVHTGVQVGYTLIYTSSGWVPTQPSGGGITSIDPLTFTSGLIATVNPYSGIGTSSAYMGGTGNLKQLTFDNNSVAISSGTSQLTNEISIGFNSGPLSKTSQTYDNSNVSIGYNAGRFYTNVNGANVSIGVEAANSLGTGTFSTLIGPYVAYSGQMMMSSIAIGDSVAFECGEITDSVLVGVSTGSRAYVNNCVAIGGGVLIYSANIRYGTYIGQSIGNGLIGSYNVCIGYDVGPRYAGGDYNVYIGNHTNTLAYNNGGSGNLVIEPSGGSSPINQWTNPNNKLSIGNIMAGDLSTKKLAIGNVGSGQLNPNSTLEVLPKNTTDIGLIVKGSPAHSANLVEVRNSADLVMANVDNVGRISGVTLFPIFSSTGGLTLTDSHHGGIIEHTGIAATGTYTIGSITNPSWNCMIINYGSGLTIASGSNVFKSYTSNYRLSNQYSSAFLYRRNNGEIFLCGDLW